MKNKVYVFSIVIINMLVGYSTQASVLTSQNNDATPQAIEQNEKKVDARMLRYWGEELRKDSKFDLSNIIANVPLILAEKKDKIAYFENSESFIPTDPKLAIGVDSNIHFEDITELIKAILDYAQKEAQEGDLTNCRNALLLIPDIALRPINLSPPEEVMYIGQEIPGNKLYSFVWLPAYLGSLYLRGTLLSIKPYVKHTQSLDPVFDAFEVLYGKLKGNSEEMKNLVHQSKNDSPEMIQANRERKEILLKFMISLKPELETAFQPIIADTVKH